MKPEQLSLFTEARKGLKSRHYVGLNIHERINVKANSFGFASEFIRQLRLGHNSYHIITSADHPEGILWKKYLLDKKLNPNSISTILWRKEYLESKKLTVLL